MAKLIITLDGREIRTLALGRRPYNDIVIDHLAVGGEHAVFLLDGGRVSVEDLGSASGTYVNGRAVTTQALRDGDLIAIGRYRMRFEQR